MDTIDTTLAFGQWLQKNREEREWTQEQLGERVCYSVHMIRKIETNQARPSEEHIPRFAAVFGVPTTDHEEFRRWARALPTLPLPAVAPPGARRSLARPTPALPQWPGALIGRAAELATLTTLLAEAPSRLLTLTGPGGVGKTRLAVQAAVETAPCFPDGAWLVDLASVPDPAGVLPQIAEALGVPSNKRRPAARQVAAYLRTKQALLVLDGAEHLVAAATQIAALLTDAPQLTILVTSRRPLHVYSEQVIPVGPLVLPAGPFTVEHMEAAPASQLFVARARTVCPGFSLDDTNAPIIATICTRLAGLPLALELAADRLRGLPLAAILAQIDQPYVLLTDGALGLPARQQSLRASMDWSYSLLTPEEQALFRGLAVFPAGGTLEAIAAVCNPGGEVASDLLDRLAALVTHNLLQVETTAAGEPCYQVPALVHPYAADLLAADPTAATIRQRYTTFLARRAPQPARCAPVPKIVPVAPQTPLMPRGTINGYEYSFLAGRFSQQIVEVPDPASRIAHLRMPVQIPPLLPSGNQAAIPPLLAARPPDTLHYQTAPRAAPPPLPSARAPDRRTRRSRLR